MKYIKKQFPVEAIQWTGTNQSEIWEICKYAKFSTDIQGNIEILLPISSNGKCETVKIGDYIVIDNNIIKYFSKKDFEESFIKYEELDSNLYNFDVAEFDTNKKYLIQLSKEYVQSHDAETVSMCAFQMKKALNACNVDAVITIPGVEEISERIVEE